MPWGSESDEHSLQTGDQGNVSKPRAASRLQCTKTKTFSTLLLRVPSATSRQSLKVSLLAPKKTVMVITQYSVTFSTCYNIPHSCVFCTVTLPAASSQLIVTLELVLFSAVLVTHIVRVCSTNKPAPPPRRKSCPEEHEAGEITSRAW